jgi:hypothetical protein
VSRPIPGRGTRPRLRRGPAAAAVLAAGAVLAAMTPVLPAVAAAAGGNGQFGLTPVPDSAGRAAAYFTLTVAPGGTATGTALVSNEAKTAETLKLSRSTGVTAGNGGSAFSRYFQRCSGVGCWVTGLPGTVTLPAGEGEQLQFTVHVPAGTPPRQYLAGLTAELATPPPSVQVGSNGKASARAIIINQVTVGVAVTVGSLSQMTTRLAIPTVSGQAIGRTARLNILLRNTGQTFTHATGGASCTAAGKRKTYTVIASTVLPHEQAVIAVNGPGLPEGVAMPCTVRLGYGSGQIVTWAGSVTVPIPPPTRIIHTGPGAYSVIPAATIPPWAIGLIAVGVMLLLAVLVLLFRMRRRSRSQAT